MKYKYGFSRYVGMTLVELMVAMVISLIIMLAVSIVYFSSKRSYSIQNAYTNMQESALYAFQYMGQNLRSAGYAGCNPTITDHLNTTASQAEFFNYVDGVYGWDYNGTGPGGNYIVPTQLAVATDATKFQDNNSNALYSTLVNKALPGSDILVIKKAKEDTTLPAPSNDVAATDLSITFPTGTQTGIQQGQIVLVSDCDGADLFMNSDLPSTNTLSRASSCGTSPLTKQANSPCNKSTPDWSHKYYAKDVHIYTSTSSAYFVGLNPAGVPALYVYNYKDGFSSPPEELVPGVENMQVLYGESTSIPDTADHFVPINQVKDLSKVYAIRISLLMRTTNKVNKKPPATAPVYNLVGADANTAVKITAPKDSHLRHVYSTTFSLPNMMVVGRK